jgi:hypothetical protein
VPACGREKFFRAIKQYSGFERCQCRTEQAVINPITIVFLGYVTLEVIRESSGLTHGEIKRCLQDKFYVYYDPGKKHGQTENENRKLKRILKHVA